VSPRLPVVLVCDRCRRAVWRGSEAALYWVMGERDPVVGGAVVRHTACAPKPFDGCVRLDELARADVADRVCALRWQADHVCKLLDDALTAAEVFESRRLVLVRYVDVPLVPLEDAAQPPFNSAEGQKPGGARENEPGISEPPHFGRHEP